MTNRVQSLRSSVTGARPSGQIPGTLFTNFADRQIGVVNASNAAVDLVAVRYFSPNAAYVAGDYVINAGQMYRAPGAIPAGAFNAGQWVAIGNAMFDQSLNTTDSVRFRLLTLGMTGVPGELRLNRDYDGTAASRIFEIPFALNTGLGLESAGGPIVLYTGPGPLGASGERMRIDATGNVGIGGIPANACKLEVYDSNASGGGIYVKNPDTGSRAYSQVRLTNNTAGEIGMIYLTGSNYTPGGFEYPSFMNVFCNAPGGMALTTSGVLTPIRFNTNGAERMRIDPAGNVGIGMTPTVKLDVLGTALIRDNRSIGALGTILYGGDAALPPYVGTNYAGPFAIATNSTERMRIEAAGNVKIGPATGTSDAILDIEQNRNDKAVVHIDNANGGTLAYSGFAASNDVAHGTGLYHYGSGFAASGVQKADGAYLFTTGNGGITLNTLTASPICFATDSIERMRITNDGWLKVKNYNSNYFYPTQPTHNFNSNDDTGYEVVNFEHHHPTNAYGLMIRFPNGNPNDTQHYYWRCYSDVFGEIARLYSNGGLGNYAGNNSNFSDAEIKTDITPYSDADLDALATSFKAVNWCRFKYKEQTTAKAWNHGYTAQAVEAAFAGIAPELVDEIDTSIRDEKTGPKIKSVYYVDLQNIAHALLARALTTIEDLKSRLANVEAKLAA